MSMAIAMTCYNRPGYLERTLATWEHVRGLEDVAERCIFIDRSDPAMEHTMECLASEHGWAHHTRLSNHGVLLNPVESVSDMFRRAATDFVILAEDDVVVSSDVLEYFTWAQRFRDDQTVGVVCAHRPQGTFVEHPRREAVARILGFSCPLVWGTWRDRWERDIQPTWDRDYRNHGWDWNLNMLMKASGHYSVFPEQNRSDHIGEAGGMHCTPAMFHETVAPDFREDVESSQYRIVEGPA